MSEVRVRSGKAIRRSIQIAEQVREKLQAAGAAGESFTLTFTVHVANGTPTGCKINKETALQLG